MESKLQSRLRKLTPELTSSLAAVNVHATATKMWSSGDLNHEEHELIKCCVEGFKAATKLLEFAFRRGDTCIKGLAKALRSVEMTKLADELDSEDTPYCDPQGQLQYYHFGDASASFELPFVCHDVTLTKDRRLLLAAGGDGMVELCCDTLVEKSRWRPPKSSFLFISYEDEVNGVAALNDGRTAVSLSQHVVLLKRGKNGSGEQATAEGGILWVEDHRISLLVSYPTCLSAHGDMLVVAAGGSRDLLQLMCNTSGRWLSTKLQRPYGIGNLAIADKVIVTVSIKAVEMSIFRSAWVLDAHSVADGDERLWHLELSWTECVGGIYADSTGGCLYATVFECAVIPSRGKGRVSVLSLSDGRELLRVALSFGSGPHHPTVPELLSLRDYGDMELQQPQSSSTARKGSCEILLVVTSHRSGTLFQPRHECGTMVTVHRSTMSVTIVPQ